MAVTPIRGLMLAHHQVRVLEGPLSMLARLFVMIPPHRCRRVLGTRPRSRLRPRVHHLPLRNPLRLPLLLENLHMMSERFVITIMPFFIMYYSLCSSPCLPFFPRHIPYRHSSVEGYHSIVLTSHRRYTKISWRLVLRLYSPSFSLILTNHLAHGSRVCSTCFLVPNCTVLFDLSTCLLLTSPPLSITPLPPLSARSTLIKSKIKNSFLMFLTRVLVSYAWTSLDCTWTTYKYRQHFPLSACDGSRKHGPESPHLAKPPDRWHTS